MENVELKTAECIALIEENAQKTAEILRENRELSRDNRSKDNIIRWLCGVIAVGIVAAAIVAGIFIYGYMYSPYLYGEINQGGDAEDSQVNIID